MIHKSHLLVYIALVGADLKSQCKMKFTEVLHVSNTRLERGEDTDDKACPLLRHVCVRSHGHRRRASTLRRHLNRKSANVGTRALGVMPSEKLWIGELVGIFYAEGVDRNGFAVVN